MTNNVKHIIEVWSQQILLPDASVYSRQWLALPAALSAAITPHELLNRYLDHIRRRTFAIIRPANIEGAIEFRLLGSSLSLLSFAPPEIFSGAGSCRLTLCLSGGILVQSGECERGRFYLSAEIISGTCTIAVELSDYCPLLLKNRTPSRLRKLLYSLTQAYIHKVVTIQFLADLYRTLSGSRASVKVKKVPAFEGEEI